MIQKLPKMAQNDLKWPDIRTFSAIFLTEKAVPQTFSLLECMPMTDPMTNCNPMTDAKNKPPDKDQNKTTN